MSSLSLDAWLARTVSCLNRDLRSASDFKFAHGPAWEGGTPQAGASDQSSKFSISRPISNH